MDKQSINWLELSDPDRLLRYAEIAQKTAPKIFASAAPSAESYFIDAENRPGNFPDLMRYCPYTMSGFRDKLTQLWAKTDLPEKERLLDIVVTAAFKNEPYPFDEEKNRREWEETIGTSASISTAAPTTPVAAPAIPSVKSTDSEPPADILASVLKYEF